MGSLTVSRTSAAHPARGAPSALPALVRRVRAIGDLAGGVGLDFPRIRAAMPGRVAEHFGLVLSESERALMEQAGIRDAKNPDQTYSDDTARKRAAAGPEIVAAADHWLKPVLARLAALPDRAVWLPNNS